ncbi:MAG: hypothetical protein JNL38_06115 [Myxococcales bacterium]|jgi:hypothetical protein|nr:hypothetical protein [Myxococcales bacterium]
MLIMCEGCHRHVRAEDVTCPFCRRVRDRSDVWAPRVAVRSRAAFLAGGLMLASTGACDRFRADRPDAQTEPVTAAPPYGVTADPRFDLPPPPTAEPPATSDAQPPRDGGARDGAPKKGP